MSEPKKVITLSPGDVWLPEGSIQQSIDKQPDTKPKTCFHEWVTQTIFRFDMTYCIKCGIEKDKA